MRKFILALSILFMASALEVSAQEVEAVHSDTLSYTIIMNNLGSSIICPDSLNTAMSKQIEKNKNRKITGFRLRIYFDNAQNARVVSEQIVAEFSAKYPDVPVYRSYVNPYFKVSVGDFRFKSDAMRFMSEIQSMYPAVFLVRESFSTI